MKSKLPLVLIAILIASFAFDIYLIYPLASFAELGFKLSGILICLILGLLFYTKQK